MIASAVAGPLAAPLSAQDDLPLDPSAAEEYYRLRLLPASLDADGSAELVLVADHVGGGGSGLLGVFVEVRLPEHLRLTNASIEGTDLAAAISDEAPLFQIVDHEERLARLAIAISADGSRRVESGVGSTLLRLGIEPVADGVIEFTGIEIGGEPGLFGLHLADGRTIRPHVRTEVPPLAAEDTAEPLVPEPTREERQTLPLVAEGGGGGPEALGATSSVCSFVDANFPPDPQFVRDIDPTSSQDMAYLEFILEITGLGSGQRVVIRFIDNVSTPVTVQFDQGLVIDASLFPDGLLLYAEDGPDSVIWTTNSGSVVRIFGGAGTGGEIQIGGMDGDDRKGFTIVGGLSGVGGGIHVDDVGAPVEIVGNIIGSAADPNRAGTDGGGIGVVNSADVTIARNEISHNVYGINLSFAGIDARGGGIHAHCRIGGALTIVENVVRSNVPEATVDPTYIFGNRSGGGISVVGVRDSTVAVCSNTVESNQGTRGCGIAATAGTLVPGGPIVTIEGNTVHENVAFLLEPLPPPPAAGQQLVFPSGGYRGGGIWIDSADSYYFEFHVLNNIVSANEILVPPTQFQGYAPTQVGGGIFVEIGWQSPTGNLNDWYVELSGNAVFENVALSQGGGIYSIFVDLVSVDPVAHYYNNTVFENELVALPLQGTGVYFAPNATFDWSTGIVHSNTPLSPASDWFAALPLAPQSNGFRYTQTGTSVAPPGSAGLFGPNCQINDPELRTYDGNKKIEFKSSPCNDSGEDAIVSSGLLSLTEDIDAEDRTLDLLLAGGASILDRGSDEFTIRFVRGDANSDNFVNMADAITLFSYMFSGGPMQNCFDAADVNDDGVLTIADPIYLLGALFPIPPTPPLIIPQPYPDCGFDGTPDTLAPCLDADPTHTPCP